jgi:hypothetical protein
MDPLSGAKAAFLIGSPVPLPAPEKFVRAIDEVEVVQGGTPTGRDAFRITLSVGREGIAALEYDLLDTGLLDPMTRLAATVLVGATPYGLINGVILDHEFTPSPEPGASKLVITGEDVTVMMDLEEKNDSYSNLPDGLVVFQVIGPYAKFGLVPPPPLPGPVETMLTRQTTQTETDFAFVTRLAARNGYVFYAEPTPAPGVSKVTWGPESRLGVPQPALAMNFSSGTTICSIKFHLDALSPREVTLPTSLSPLDLGDVALSVPSLSIPLASSPLAAVRTRMARDAAKLSAAKTKVRLSAAKALSPDALVGDGEVDVARYGQPLQARGLVGVRGVGPAHGGLYYVRQVVHKLRPRSGDYLQKFRIVREGRGATTPVVRP